MTFVAAKIHHGKITIVGDTQITDNRRGHDRANRHIYENAMPKIALLRRDLVVAVADDNPHSSIRRACQLRASPAVDVVHSLAEQSFGDFIIATLNPDLRLWQIKNREVSDRTALGRCFIGAAAADEHFRTQYEMLDESGDREVDFLMSGALQWLLNFDAVQGVGGYPTRVSTTSNGFRFLPDQAAVGPDDVDAVVTRVAGGFQFKICVPKGVSSQGYDIHIAVGRPPTIGAFACFIPQARTARLFREDVPWEAQQMRVESVDELIERAMREHGQTLYFPSGAFS